MARPFRGVPTNISEGGDALRAITRFGSGADEIEQGTRAIAAGVNELANVVIDARERADTAADALLATRAMGDARTRIMERTAQLDPLAPDYAAQVAQITEEVTGSSLEGVTFARNQSRRDFQVRMAELGTNVQVNAAETRIRAVRTEAEAAMRESMETARAEIELNPRNAQAILARVRGEIQGMTGVFPQATLDRMARGFARDVLQAEVTGRIRQGDVGGARRLVDQALAEGGVNPATARALRSAVQAAANRRATGENAQEAEQYRQLMDAALRSQNDPEALAGLLQNVEGLIEDGRFSRTPGTIAQAQRVLTTIQGYIRGGERAAAAEGRAGDREVRTQETEIFRGLEALATEARNDPERIQGVLTALDQNIEAGQFTTEAGLRRARQLRAELGRAAGGNSGEALARQIRGMLGSAERETRATAQAVQTVLDGGAVTPAVAARALPALADAHLQQRLQQEGRGVETVTEADRTQADLTAGLLIAGRGVRDVPPQVAQRLRGMETSANPADRAAAAQSWRQFHDANPEAAARLRRQLPNTDALLIATQQEGVDPSPQLLQQTAQAMLTLGADTVAARGRAAVERLGAQEGRINPRTEVQAAIGTAAPELVPTYQRAFQAAYAMSGDEAVARQQAQEAVRAAAPLSRVGTSEFRVMNGTSLEQATPPPVRRAIGGDGRFAEIVTEHLRGQFEAAGIRGARFSVVPIADTAARDRARGPAGQIPFVVRYQTPDGLFGVVGTPESPTIIYAPQTYDEALSMFPNLRRQDAEAREQPGTTAEERRRARQIREDEQRAGRLLRGQPARPNQ